MDSATPFQPWTPKDGSKVVKSEEELADDAKLQRENVNHPKHTQTASHDKESVVASIESPGTSAGAEHEATAPATETKMDSEKISSMQHIVENTLSSTERQRVGQLLVAIEGLSGPERLLLYLRLPTGVPPHDPLKQPINPLGSRAELQQTITWIQTHLEVDPDVSLPKQDVYDEYIAFCMSSNMKPLSTADFGKVMKQVYPSVRPRRLGTRGNSRYCYAGLRKKIKLEVPQLPDLGESSRTTTIHDPDVASQGSERIVCDWAETKLGVKFNTIAELSLYLQSGASIVGPAPVSPTPTPALPQPYVGGPGEEQSSRQLMKQLKRKIQTQTHPGRPKKNKGGEIPGPAAPSASFVPGPSIKHETEANYGYGYMPVYEAPFSQYTAPRYYEPTFDNLPMNLSSDSSLDLSSERAEWPRRRPPEPPPQRLPLPGKKLILETYRADSERTPAHYLPKKMRAAEILGGKRPPETRAPPDARPEPEHRAEVAFLEDPKNATSRSKSIAAALVREEREATPTRAAPIPEPDKGGPCCGLDGINIKTGVICEEKHSEILNRERVISICNMDKHALDDYLNEGSGQEHEEELLQYFQRDADSETRTTRDGFSETRLNPRDDHGRGKNEKLSQLRELLAKNLKNQNGSNSPSISIDHGDQFTAANNERSENEGFKPVNGTSATITDNEVLQTNVKNDTIDKQVTNDLKSAALSQTRYNTLMKFSGQYAGDGTAQSVPQSPTTRAQQYDFVPISADRGSPGKSPARLPSPAASPFVSPRATPVPRSRLCPRVCPRPARRRHRALLSADAAKRFVVPTDIPKYGPSSKYYQPMSAPPSPNILCHQFKSQMVNCVSGVTNGGPNLTLNFLPANQFRETANGDHSQPLSADPLSREVSQFFQDAMVPFSPDTTFRSQSVPLKQGLSSMSILSYNNTPVGSVTPTPIPHEFSDFGSLAETCDISKACLNPESLDKIYDAIDSSNDVLNTSAATDLIDAGDNLTNGCDTLSDQQILTDVHLNALIPNNDSLLDRDTQYNDTFAEDGGVSDNVEELLKRTNSIEFDLSDLDLDKSKYYTSRSVPSTPLPYKRVLPSLELGARLSRESFATSSYMTNGISSKSVPSTPQLAPERGAFSYTQRDFLINGNNVEPSIGLDGMLEPLNPTADLLADLDKIDSVYM